MALPSLADLLSAFEIRLGVAVGSLAGVDKARAEAAITDAMGLVTDAYGGTIPDPTPAAAAAVVLSSAKRGYVNPGGYISETIDDYTYRRESGAASGVYLTDAERASLSAGGGTGGLWSLSTTRGEPVDTLFVYDQWADQTLDGGDPIPFETDPLT